MKTFIMSSVQVLLAACLWVGTVAAMPDGPGCENGKPAMHRHDCGRAEIGAPAPQFTLEGVANLEFKKVSLSDFRGKWVVLFFYPGDFTPVCHSEIKGLGRATAEFVRANAQVLAISADSKLSHLAWIKSGALDTPQFPILSDFNKRTARAYGVLDEESGQARRGLFIIDPNGVVQYQVVHSNKVGRSVDETLRVLRALQTDELCPLNWKPGDKTLEKH